MQRTITAAIVLVFVASACKTRSRPNDASDLQFALSDVSNSILPDIEAVDGNLDVCLALIGFEPAEKASATARFEDMLTRVPNAWNNLLKGNPEWPVQHQLKVNFTVQSSHCPKSTRGFNANVWKNKTDFINDFCSEYPDGMCSSGALVATKGFAIGPVNRGHDADIYDYFTLLHEYGHLLALGDTYRNPGLSDWVTNQPPSVMNGQNFPRENFTSDDQWGLWATLHAVKTGSRSCFGYGDTVDMILNSWKEVMCDPRSQPEYAHTSIDSLPEMPDIGNGGSGSGGEPPMKAGKWTYKGYESASYYMIVKAKSATDVTLIGFTNGVASSGTGTLYKCGTTAPIVCRAASASGFEVRLVSKTSGILVTPSIPTGVGIDYLDE